MAYIRLLNIHILFKVHHLGKQIWYLTDEFKIKWEVKPWKFVEETSEKVLLKPTHSLSIKPFATSLVLQWSTLQLEFGHEPHIVKIISRFILSNKYQEHVQKDIREYY